MCSNQEELRNRPMLIADRWQLETMNTLDCDPMGEFFDRDEEIDGPPDSKLPPIDLGPFGPDDDEGESPS